MNSETVQSGPAGYDSFEVRLGDELRGERATLGRSLLDVQRDLRIKAAYIAAIEDCDPSVFPNRGFVAGYVRSYARYLALDPEEVFERFCSESGFQGVNSDLKREAKSSKGNVVLAGPVVASKDDAIWRNVTPVTSSGSISDIPVSAIGSVLVLVAVVFGLLYGGYAVLQDIQRVEIAPVDQVPGALSEIASFNEPGLGAEVVELAQQTSVSTSPTDQDLNRLYLPRELEVPIIVSRDGPIVDIDPNQTGAQARPDNERRFETAIAAAVTLDEANADNPRVREDIGPPTVNIAAERAAWVRVYLADGTVLFEKILEPGEVYTLPADVEAPLLRAGNSGSVFMLVDGVTYGPAGKGTGVAKQVSLLPDDIRTVFSELDEVPDEIQASLQASTSDPIQE